MSAFATESRSLPGSPINFCGFPPPSSARSSDIMGRNNPPRRLQHGIVIFSSRPTSGVTRHTCVDSGVK